MADELGPSPGERIQYWRERRHCSQIEIARHLDRAQSTVAQWETGRRPVKAADVERIAEYLGVHMSIWYQDLPGYGARSSTHR